MEISKGEIKEMVPPTGLAKIMRLLLKVGSLIVVLHVHIHWLSCVCGTMLPVFNFLQEPVLLPIGSSGHPAPSSAASQPNSPPASPSFSPTSCGPGSPSSVSTTLSSVDKAYIPDFWRDDTQRCIDEGVLDDASRSDIVRTLVTLLVSKYGPKPGRVRLEEVGRALILKYPFMKDDIGNGYVSVLHYYCTFD